MALLPILDQDMAISEKYVCIPNCLTIITYIPCKNCFQYASIQQPELY